MDSSSNQTQTSGDKCWLIRTTQRQLLGPVSKEKILSFLEKGALAPEDELTSGNGYWFSVKEKDLVEKYLLGDIPQSFNPISEAPSVLTAARDQKEGTASLHPNPVPNKEELKAQAAAQTNSSEEEVHLPAQDDLEYPDLNAPIDIGGEFEMEESSSDDITTVLKLDNLAKPAVEEKRKPAPQESQRAQLIAEVDEEAQLPDQADLEYPDMGMDFSTEEATPLPQAEEVDLAQDHDEHTDEPAELENETVEVEADQTEKTSKKKAQKRKKKIIEAPQRNDRYLFYLLALLILLTLSVFYYYKKVLNKPFPVIGQLTSLVISEAQSQVLAPDPLAIKKKDFLI